MTRSASLSSGIIKFAPNGEYVKNLDTFRLALRPNKYHWKDKKPPLRKSLHWLHEELWKVGGKQECRFLLEYGMQDIIKLILDVEWVTPGLVSLQQAFDTVNSSVIGPVHTFLEAKTGRSFSLNDIVVTEACRQTPDGNWKQSFHLIWKDVCLEAVYISHLADHLELSSCVDRAPFRGQ